jgi:hypothetical protein
MDPWFFRFFPDYEKARHTQDAGRVFQQLLHQGFGLPGHGGRPCYQPGQFGMKPLVVGPKIAQQHGDHGQINTTDNEAAQFKIWIV